MKRKALSSLRHAMTIFNSPHDDGRVTAVLLSMQHAFEMLLKAALVQRRLRVFDPALGRSIGLEQCLRLASNDRLVKLSKEEAGTIRAIDAMRDDEQHWYNLVSEQILYVHARAAVTLFDDLLRRIFSDTLADHLPSRVLPISVDAPQDLHLLVDQEYSQIRKLLAPGRRATHEAYARIRTLLALEAHVDPDTRVSTKDVQRVAKGAKSGVTWDKAFPRLGQIGTSVAGQGVSVVVRFSQTQGMPVRYVKGNVPEGADAAAIREFDLQKRYHLTVAGLAQRLGLTPPRCKALRDHLGVDGDAAYRHVFEFGSQKHPRYSDNALRDLKKAAETLDLDAIWESHRSGRGAGKRAECTQPGCAAGKKPRKAS
ncbi:hypothetical protein DRA43_12335 [Micromonospora provocatoris]|nr:hypothetical protein DRA43_12335 [Micromonospora provocatoris]